MEQHSKALVTAAPWKDAGSSRLGTLRVLAALLLLAAPEAPVLLHSGHHGSNSSANIGRLKLKSRSVEAQQHGASTGAARLHAHAMPSEEFEP